MQGKVPRKLQVFGKLVNHIKNETIHSRRHQGDVFSGPRGLVVWWWFGTTHSLTQNHNNKKLQDVKRQAGD